MNHGNNKTIGGGGFHHVAIKVSDFDTSVRFYIDAFGFVEKIRWGEGDKRGILLDTGDGNYLEIFAGAPAGPRPDGPIFHFALRTDDCDAAVERARHAGATVTMEPRDLDIPSTPPTHVRIAFVTAPDGAVIEFFENELT